MGAILPDLRAAFASLSRTPGFTLIAVVTLALGIGANTSMFSTLNGYVLRPSPYPDSDRIDRIYRASPEARRGGVCPADYSALRSELRPYGEIAAYADLNVNLSEPGKAPAKADGLRASADLFSVLGATPLMGRAFRTDEEIFGNHHVVVLSHRFWRVQFGGDQDVVGRMVRVDGEPHEIVGVLPESFSDWRHLEGVDLYRPLAFDEKERADRDATWLRLVGRRAPGVTQAQGQELVAAFGRRVAKELPAANVETAWHTLPIGQSFLPRTGQLMMTMLVGLSGFVLLIACSNLANLLLARTMARAREFAVRAALGASRAQMLRPLLFESLILAAAGGACALVVAQWTFDWMAVASVADNGVGVDFGFDGRVLLWAFGISLFTVLAFGAVPALFVHRLDLNATLKSGGRGSTTGRGHQRFRQLLVLGQSALAMVLLAGAALFAGGLHELNNRRVGWESDRLVTGTIVLPIPTYPGAREISDIHRRILERLQALPGVAVASLSYGMPYFGLAEPRKYLVSGREAPAPGREPVAAVNGVTPSYFETVGTRILEGRGFDARDDAAAPLVFVVNATMARSLFPGGSALGRRIAEAGGGPPRWGEIVGVAADIEPSLDDPGRVALQLYQPMAQEPRRTCDVAVRTAGVAPGAIVDSVRAAMAELDPDLPVRRLQHADATIARANYGLGVLRTILVSLAVLGLGLAALGTFGVNARAVAQRRSEFGIRLALGAQGRDILRLVLGSGAKLALLGALLGLAGAFAMTRLFVSAFPGMRPDSLPAAIGAATLLVAVALGACYVPARQASRTSPMETLRTE